MPRKTHKPIPAGGRKAYREIADEGRDNRTATIQRQLHNAWVGRHLGAAPQDLRPNTAH